MRNQDEVTAFINFHLDEKCDQAIDYDYAHSVLADKDSEEFDLFVRLSYEFSERASLFTDAQIKKFAIKLASLAVNTLVFNLSQSDDATEAQLEFASTALR